MDEFLNMVESFCNNGGFLQIGLRDPETLRVYAETAHNLRRSNKTLSHDEKMILTRIEVIFVEHMETLIVRLLIWLPACNTKTMI